MTGCMGIVRSNPRWPPLHAARTTRTQPHSRDSMRQHGPHLDLEALAPQRRHGRAAVSAALTELLDRQIERLQQRE
jgi:hypothetical protein